MERGRSRPPPSPPCSSLRRPVRSRPTQHGSPAPPSPRVAAAHAPRRAGIVFSDDDFAALYPDLGQPAYSPWRLALVTVLQFREDLSDRPAADAVRARIDWKYLLGLPIDDPGFDASVLCEFRARLVDGEAEHVLLDRVLDACRDRRAPQAGPPADRLHPRRRRRPRAEPAGTGRRDGPGHARRARGRGSRLGPHTGRSPMVRPLRPTRRGHPPPPGGRRGGHAGPRAPTATPSSTLSTPTTRPPASRRSRSSTRSAACRADTTSATPTAKASRPASSADVGRTRATRSSRRTTSTRGSGRKRSTRSTGYMVHLTETCDEDRPRLVVHADTTPATSTRPCGPTPSSAPSTAGALGRRAPGRRGLRQRQPLVGMEDRYGVRLVGPPRGDVAGRSGRGRVHRRPLRPRLGPRGRDVPRGQGEPDVADLHRSGPGRVRRPPVRPGGLPGLCRPRPLRPVEERRADAPLHPEREQTALEAMRAELDDGGGVGSVRGTVRGRGDALAGRAVMGLRRAGTQADKTRLATSRRPPSSAPTGAVVGQRSLAGARPGLTFSGAGSVNRLRQQYPVSTTTSPRHQRLPRHARRTTASRSLTRRPPCGPPPRPQRDATGMGAG